MQDLLIEAEQVLLDRLTARWETPNEAPVVFVLGSPRTGSTRLYQAIARFLQLPYVTNLANTVFPKQPILAFVIQKEALPTLEIVLDAKYGKTEGAYQPSEASAVMMHWCGGGHPSAIVSARVLPGMERHMARTIAATQTLFQAPLVIKNPWNCFRIASLATLFPKAHFVWVRRNITASALSDLASRYVTHGTPNEWNSATPANVDELRKLPYWAQVVENQYEFARSIEPGLSQYAQGRHSIVWFERFISEPAKVLDELANVLGEMTSARPPKEVHLGSGEVAAKPFQPGDEDNVKAYVREHQTRLAGCIYQR